MNWFEAFATEGLAYPAFLIAFGTLLILRAPSAHVPTAAELQAASWWVRGLAKLNRPMLHRRCGWLIVVFGGIIAVVRLTDDFTFS